MGHVITWLKEGLLCAGFFTLAIAGLVLFIVLGRPLMIVVAALTIGAVVLSCVSSRFRDWFEGLGEPQTGQPPAIGHGHGAPSKL